MSIIRFGIVGGGWRTEFFIRVAQALPEMFQVSQVMVRDAAKGQALSAKMNVKTCQTLDELLADKDIEFVVLSVTSSAHPKLLTELANRKVAVLCETPSARSIPEMNEVFALVQNGLRVQVAEQLHLRPLHAARIGIANAGLLGDIQQAQVSVAHGYHGVSLIRRLLGLTYEDATITATHVKSTSIVGPNRFGPPPAHKEEEITQELAWLNFGSKFGVFDFAGSQYASYIRSSRMLVRGSKGEISGDTLRYLKDYKTPIYTQLRRESMGQYDNLQGWYLQGILAGEQWVYTNPFAPSRMSDDEIAVASCLKKMSEYLQGGEEFYSLAEACQDNYLSLLMSKAATTGQPQTSTKQVWAS